MSRSIVLFGMMGVGKTTVARLVAERLGRAVVDTDADVERRAGSSIPAIFAGDGEAAFRDLEREVVADATGRGDVVIALGGGAVLDDANVAAARAAGVLVRLEADPDVLVERLTGQAGGTERRPLLDGDEPGAALRRTLDRRAARYAEVADLTVDATGPAPEVADAVLGAVAAHGGVLSELEARRVTA